MADLRINGRLISRNTVASLDAAHFGLSEKLWSVIQTFLLEWWNEKDSIEVHTSGSTGKPKTIRLLKSTVTASADKTIAHFELQSDDLALLCLPVNYIAGKLMLVRALRCGMQIIATKPSLHPLAETNEPVSFAAMIPSQVSNALKEDHTKKRLAEIKTVLIGGAPMEPQLETSLKALPNRFFHSYGMTETATHIALREIGKAEHYKTLPGVSCSTDDRGCLVIDADHLSQQIITNDLVALMDQHRFKWLGRIDNAIISGGLKHLPEMLEHKIAPFLQEPFYIAGAPDNELGQKLVLVVEGIPWSETQCDELRQKLETGLRKHEVPADIRFREKFQRTETGKILRVI